ncbi:MAG: radical SAM protein [Nitrospirota bacterium]|nr:radical SAM protein [Nitrospirota bacterium]
MGRCGLCNTSSPHISRELGVCLNCIRNKPEDALPIAMQAHARSRKAFGLPESPPKDPHGARCGLCVNECSIPETGLGYCGLRTNSGGKIKGVSAAEGKLSWYHDPLPTNCVGDWVCPGGTGAGYPRYAYRDGPETGYKNLAVFFHACSFNCLFCQNWQFKNETLKPGTTPVQSLVSAVDDRTSCICYFGGDPVPQLPFSIRASRLAIRENSERILRICWETNGSMNRGLLDEILKISLNSGGCIKFDLKAWNENLHIALTGSTNRRTLENFSLAGEKIGLRPVPPLLVANTLLVPGYIDEAEIRNIARFIASVHPDIPYSMLAFYPHFYMSDMPLTKRHAAERYVGIAHEEGLRNVRLGNLHLFV